MIHFYKDELKLIDQGEKAEKFMTRPLIKRFIEKGILIYTPSPKALVLSREGRKLLGIPFTDEII